MFTESKKIPRLYWRINGSKELGLRYYPAALWGIGEAECWDYHYPVLWYTSAEIIVVVLEERLKPRVRSITYWELFDLIAEVVADCTADGVLVG